MSEHDVPDTRPIEDADDEKSATKKEGPMITIKHVTDGDEYKGVTVMYHGEGDPTVDVHCTHPPLAIEMLKHAIVAMESRQEMSRKFEKLNR